jgi:hypothetical protein
MVGDTADHLAQGGFRAEAIELGGFDKRIDYGSALAAGIGAGEQIILPAQGERTNRALGASANMPRYALASQ